MPQRDNSLTALEARKKMLVLEAEIHRLRLKTEAREAVANAVVMIESAKQTAQKAVTILSSVALAAGAVKAVSAFTHSHKSHEEKSEKPSLMSRVFSAAKFGARMWMNYKNNQENQETEE